MENNIKTFSLFIREDVKSKQIADNIRKINHASASALKEVSNGDLVIAIGGDGTFIDSVTSTGFNKSAVYAGLHTGTLGFLQNLSAEEVYSFVKYIGYEKEIKTRKLLVSEVVVNLMNKEPLHYYSLNEVLVAGIGYSKISFAEYINGELLQHVVGNGIIIATDTGDTAYSMNSGGAIDFSNHFQLVCTPLTPIVNAAYERFITNPIICSNVSIVPKSSDNISIIIDGFPKNIESSQIESVNVSMVDGSNYINKLEIGEYSKCSIIRQKILGYDDF